MIRRGDVVIVAIPFTDVAGFKKRPCVVVQADVYNQTIRKTVVAICTGNLRRIGRPESLVRGPRDPGRGVVRAVWPVARVLLQPIHSGTGADRASDRPPFGRAEDKAQ